LMFCTGMRKFSHSEEESKPFYNLF
jgi:hypothetical protein